MNSLKLISLIYLIAAPISAVLLIVISISLMLSGYDITKVEILYDEEGTWAMVGIFIFLVNCLFIAICIVAMVHSRGFNKIHPDELYTLRILMSLYIFKIVMWPLRMLMSRKKAETGKIGQTVKTLSIGMLCFLLVSFFLPDRIQWLVGVYMWCFALFLYKNSIVFLNLHPNQQN